MDNKKTFVTVQVKFGFTDLCGREGKDLILTRYLNFESSRGKNSTSYINHCYLESSNNHDLD